MKRRTFLGLVLGAPAGMAVARLKLPDSPGTVPMLVNREGGVLPLAKQVDDYYKGRMLIGWRGPLQHQASRITGYDADTRTFKLDCGWAQQPSADDTLIII